MSTPLRVLLVEDRENDALLMLRELRRASYEPVSHRVATRQALIAALNQDVWDIVLADYSMPNFNGLEALAATRELVPDVPFVIVSGVIGEEAAISAMKSGADDFVLKYNLSRLGPVIDRELRDVAVQRARRDAEQSVRNRDILFRSVIENVADLILILNEDGTIRYCSPSVGRTLGYGPDELIGKGGLEFLHPDEQFAAIAALTEPEQDSDGPLVACRVNHKDGSWRVLEGTISNLLADSIVAGFVCNLRDVTQQRTAHRQLVRAQRMESIGNLAGVIAHDLNNMLTPILVAAEMLQEDLPQPDRETLLQGLTSGANRAADIVHQLLLFAKGMRANQEAAGVTELVRETERLLRFGFPKSISVHTVLPDAVWPVQIGATEFTQVLMNLCVNSRDAMPEGGQLRLSAANVTIAPRDVGMYSKITPGRYVVVNVADTGIGIPAEIQGRIFDPFFTTKGKDGGTGLGLSTSSNIVKENGGFIKLYSEVGHGTRFAVYLPAVGTPEARTPADSPDSSPAGHGELVLVIDDESAIREILKETLEAFGYRVVTAADGAIGLALYRDHSTDFDLVIVDLAMPILDGPATIAAIRKLSPQARIILQSGIVSERSLSLLNPQAADAFLEKPYATHELLRCVHDLLQRR